MQYISKVIFYFAYQILLFNLSGIRHAITKVAKHHLMQLSFTCKTTSVVKRRKRGIKY